MGARVLRPAVAAVGVDLHGCQPAKFGDRGGNMDQVDFGVLHPLPDLEDSPGALLLGNRQQHFGELRRDWQ